MTTLRLRLTGATMSVGVLAALLALSCGGSSTSSDDDDGGSGGSGASGGSAATGGSGASGGSAATGGSAASGGSGGTGMIGPIGDCEDFAACGGDPEGAWRVTDVCSEVATSMLLPAAGCEDAITGFDINYVGTYTFANGMMSFDGSVAYDLSLEIDDVCASSLAETAGVSAALLCPLLQASYADLGAESASCDTSNGNCVCVLSFPPEQSTAEPLAYTVSGSQLETSDGERIDFCVQGDTLGMHARTAADEETQLSVTMTLERE